MRELTKLENNAEKRAMLNLAEVDLVDFDLAASQGAVFRRRIADVVKEDVPDFDPAESGDAALERARIVEAKQFVARLKEARRLVARLERDIALSVGNVSALWAREKSALQNLMLVPGAHQAVQAVLSRLPPDFSLDAPDAYAAVKQATESAALSSDDEERVRQARARMAGGTRVLGHRLEEVTAVLKMMDLSFDRRKRK
jgi:hypothetical protein